MHRTKWLIKFGLLVLIIFIISSIWIDFLIDRTYTNLDTYITSSSDFKFEIKESKKTYINGYVIGTVKNNTLSRVDDKYIKLEFYSKHDNLMGTDYVALENFKTGETKEFRHNFNYTDIGRTNISIVDDSSKEDEVQEQWLLDEEYTWLWDIARIIIGISIPWLLLGMIFK